MASILGIHVPLEVWEQIFSYLSTTDIINFCAISPDEYGVFLREDGVVRNFNIGCDYNFTEIDLYNYITENVSYQYIRTLNINKLYWVKLDDLRKLVKLLPRLEELFALNTALSVRPKDLVLYGKLKTLALSIEASHLISPDLTLFKKLYLLKKLCLHITRKHPKSSYGLYKFFTELFALQELWIFDSDSSDPHPLSYDSLVEKLKFLKRLVIKSRVHIPFLDYKCFGLAKYFETRRFKSITMRYEWIPKEQIIPFKEVSIFHPLETKLEKAWDVFREYRSEMPYDHKAHRELYTTKQIHKIKFEELNFFHNKCFCTKDYVKATWDFLMAENSQYLKKLSIKSCVLQREFVNKNQITVGNLIRKYPLAEIVENCPLVNTLELMQCSSCNVTIIDAYPLICKWKHLEKVTLELPPHVTGSFLIELIKSCTKLRLLRIISYNTNENLNRHTYKALPFATQLQDFCYENKSINLPVMFESLSKIRSKKLRRVFISCEHSDATSTKALEMFLDVNPQLVLLFLAVQTSPKSFLQTAQHLMNQYKMNSRYKQFYAKTDARSFIKNYHVCEAEEELFNYDSAVSTVNFYDFR